MRTAFASRMKQRIDVRRSPETGHRRRLVVRSGSIQNGHGCPSYVRLRAARSAAAVLSEREKDVIANLCAGVTNRQIGDFVVGVSESDGRVYVIAFTHPCKKLSVSNRLQLLRFGVRTNLNLSSRARLTAGSVKPRNCPRFPRRQALTHRAPLRIASNSISILLIVQPQSAAVLSGRTPADEPDRVGGKPQYFLSKSMHVDAEWWIR